VIFSHTSNGILWSVLQGTDYIPTRRVRNRLFPDGELDDGGNADPPLCVSLPPSLGRELCNPGTSLQDADRHACAPEANKAALQADTETEFVQVSIPYGNGIGYGARNANLKYG
jgi:hypothetical protein